jgi:hypothetical protein
MTSSTCTWTEFLPRITYPILEENKNENCTDSVLTFEKQLPLTSDPLSVLRTFGFSIDEVFKKGSPWLATCQQAMGQFEETMKVASKQLMLQLETSGELARFEAFKTKITDTVERLRVYEDLFLHESSSRSDVGPAETLGFCVVGVDGLLKGQDPTKPSTLLPGTEIGSSNTMYEVTKSPFLLLWDWEDQTDLYGWMQAIVHQAPKRFMRVRVKQTHRCFVGASYSEFESFHFIKHQYSHVTVDREIDCSTIIKGALHELSHFIIPLQIVHPIKVPSLKRSLENVQDLYRAWAKSPVSSKRKSEEGGWVIPKHIKLIAEDPDILE